MSVSDLTAYLIGWGELVLKWHKNKELGKPVDFPETGYKWSELGKLAQKFYTDFGTESFQDLLTRLDKTVTDILPVTDKKTNNNFMRRSGTITELLAGCSS